MLKEVKVNGHVLCTDMPSVEEIVQEIREVISLDMNYVPIDMDWYTYGYVGIKELDSEKYKFRFIVTDDSLYIDLDSFDIALVNGDKDRIVIKEVFNENVNVQTINEEVPMYVYDNAYVYIGKCDLELEQASDIVYVKIKIR